MLRTFSFDYDKENDSLFLFDKKNKSKHSLKYGNMFFDIDNKDNLVGIELREASKFLSNITENKVKQEELEILVSAKLSMQEVGGILVIKLYLTIPRGLTQETIPVTITVPARHKKAAAFA